jgi:hypothetical protein
MADGDTTYYAITNDTDWEVGIGTYSTTGPTLARTTILASSNGGSAVSWGAGVKNIFISYAASKSVYLDANGDLLVSDKIIHDGDTNTAIRFPAADTVSVETGGTERLKVENSTITTTVPILLPADPTLPLQAATKEYVDTIASAGIHYHAPVRVENPANLNATYNNGTSGVGATLTNAGTQVALVIDGVTVATNDRVLVYEQTDQTQNGVYVVTSTGSGSTNWVLTRSTDTDSYGPSDPDALGAGDAFFVQQGNTGAGELYVCNTEGTITFGTTNITFTQIAATAVYTAGTAISVTNNVITNTAPDQTVTLTQGGATSISGTYPNFTITSTDTTYSAGNGIGLAGTTFSVAAGSGLTQDASGLSHADTSSQSSVDNSGATFVQDVTLDTFGHVTGLASVTVTPSLIGAPSTTGVGASGSWGISVTGTASNVTGTVAIANGGTGATTAGQALNNLGLTATATELNYTSGVTSAIQTQLNAKAPLASPALSGTPTAPTASVGTDTTQIATTAFVNAEIANDAPTKTGGGASGTWNIAISGNAATATSATTSTSTTNPTFSGDAVNKADITTRTESGFYEHDTGTTAEGWPRNDGTWQHMIASTHSNDSNYFSMQLAGGFFTQQWYMRNTNNNGSTSWSELLTSASYSSYALPLSGGTLTGTTTISNSSPVFILRDSDSTGANQLGWISFQDNGGVERAWFGYGTTANADINIANTQGGVTIQGSTALTAGNYNSYSPSLTGSGASGTWGISITGDAGSVDGLSPPQFYNNMGQNHNTQTDFNAVSDFGARYLQGGTNGPTVDTSDQFYGFTMGLGNDYPLSQYGSQFYWPRAAQDANTYIYVRDREGGSWGSWRKTQAGYADSAGSADQIDGFGFRNTGSNSAVNADTLDSNGITYYTAGVPNFTGNATDGALYSQAYSSSWQHQIAADYRSGQIALRGKNSGTWQSWRTVLDSSNYTSYAPSLTGSGASGNWGINVTGSAGSVAWGSVTSKPSNIMYYQGFTLDANTMDSNSTGFTYSVNAPATGPVARFSTGGGYDLWLNAPYSGGNNLYFRTRNGDNNTLNSWRTVLNDANYTSYAPSLTGSGASGTWGINVTGNAATASTASALSATTWQRITGSGITQGSYGSISVTGSTSGYIGINFPDYNLTWMSDNQSSVSFGVYKNNSSWAFYFDNSGTLQVGTIPAARVSGTVAAATSATTATTATTANALATGNNYQVNSLGVGTGGSGTAGEIRATNNITAYFSDDRLKTRFGNIDDALGKLVSLSGFYYEPNGVAQALGYEVKKEVGVSAQEVQAVMPEAVAPAPIDEKYLTVRYERLVPLLIEAIKEQQAQIDELRAKLEG